jgi:hypothetical protein
MSKRTDILRQALEEDRVQRQQIRDYKLIVALAKEEVARRITAGDFNRYQRLQSILIGEIHVPEE